MGHQEDAGHLRLDGRNGASRQAVAAGRGTGRIGARCSIRRGGQLRRDRVHHSAMSATHSRGDWLHEASLVAAPLLLGFAAAAAVIVVNGGSIGMLFTAFYNTVTNRNGLLQTVASGTALALTAQCFIIGFRCGVFNIGAEGALFAGAIAAIQVGAFWPLPQGIHLAAVMLAAMLAGAAWLYPVALLKTYRNVNEIVTTIMMNFIGRYLLAFFVMWVFRDTKVDTGAFSVPIRPTGRFPVIASPLTWACLLAVVVPVVAYVLLWHTRFGAHIRATGYNADAARGAGIDVRRLGAMVFLAGGAAAGLAGCVLTAGLSPTFKVGEDLSALRNFGLLGISVAMIGRNHPLGAMLASFFVAAVRTSRFQFQKMGVAPEVTEIFIGVVIFAFAFPYVFQSAATWIKAIRRSRWGSEEHG
ncbi:MAG: hypothetical protein U1E53_27740 [Dongiaceae bacterium]